MGAQGIWFFCGVSHLFNCIEEGLWWDEALQKESRRISKGGCPCGNKEVFKIYHYGGLNDCICLEEEAATEGIVDTDKIDEITVSIPDAIDKDGNLVEAYRKIQLKVYKIPDKVKTMYREN